ncbi:MAG: ribonuclease III family protein [Candidatus Coproplasma sp.]
MDFKEVERSCGYTFEDKRLLERALTLSSYDNRFNNESLECLGDALLGFIVAEKYYLQGLSEGDITKKKQEYLSDDALKAVSEKLGLHLALLHDKGDSRNKKAIPSAYEALTAAIYLDGGMQAAKDFAYSTLSPAPHSFNYVGAVQELLQGNGEPSPEYSQEDIGTPRKPVLKVTVKVRGREFSAEDFSGSSAKRKAAKLAYEFLINSHS